MAVLKTRINGTASESVEEAAIHSGAGTKAGIDGAPENWESDRIENERAAARYDSGSVKGVNIYCCQHPAQTRRHGRG